jgi:hypothetical protein
LRDGLRPLSGSPAVAPKALHQAFENLRLDRENLDPAGVRMRDLPGDPLTPIEPRGLVTCARTLSFRWQAALGSTGPYRLRVAREGNDVLYEAIVEGSELTLPNAERLPSGERLFWQVEDVSTSRGARQRWQSFVLATEPARKLAREVASQSSNATAAEANLLDLLLMQRMRAGQ